MFITKLLIAILINSASKRSEKIAEAILGKKSE